MLETQCAGVADHGWQCGPFVFLIQSAGIEETDAAKQFIRIKREVTVEETGKSSFLPFEGFKVSPLPRFRPSGLSVAAASCQCGFLQATSLRQGSEPGTTFGFMRELSICAHRNLALG